MLTNPALEKLLAEKFDTPEFDRIARIYADWLLEHDARAGEFILRQLTLEPSARQAHETACSRELFGHEHTKWSNGFVRSVNDERVALSPLLHHPAMRLLSKLMCTTASLERALAEPPLSLPPSLTRLTLSSVPTDSQRLERILSDHRLEPVNELLLLAYHPERPPQPAPAQAPFIRSMSVEEQAESRRDLRAVLDAVMTAPSARRWGRRLVLHLQASDVRAMRATVRQALPEVFFRPRFSWGAVGFRATTTPRFAPANWSSLTERTELPDGAVASPGEQLELRGEEMCATCGSSELRHIYKRRWSWNAGRRPSTGVMHTGWGRQEEFVCNECGAFTSLEEFDEPSFSSRETWDDDSWRT